VEIDQPVKQVEECEWWGSKQSYIKPLPIQWTNDMFSITELFC